MLNLVFNRGHRNCEGTSRREFLKVGALGTGAFTLPHLLRARAQAAQAGRTVKNTSVVWLWLGGGPTHVETFDPKMTAPSEYRSVTGEESTPIPGVTVGGTLPKIASVADKMAFVRSFAHTNSGHGGGTHFVMTGYDNRTVDNGGVPSRPSIGSILSRVRGSSHPETGVPTYIRMGGILGDGPAFLGTGYGPFDQNGKARKDMSLPVAEDRVGDRRHLLGSLDTLNREVERTGVMQGLDQFEQQAFNLVFGNGTKAFDLKGESQKTRDAYGNGLGEQLLIARRLCEVGCGFVTVQYGGWDMHGEIEKSMKNRSPSLDRAVSAFVQDVYDRGLSENILLVVTGEFGRTPRVNKNAGRDHWAPLSTLALAGGGLRMGQVVGESASKLDVPKTTPIRPQDLMATVFHVLGIEQKQQFPSPSGRPVYLVENGKPITDLI